MTKDLSEYEASIQEDGAEYTIANATGQAVGFALAYAIKNRHLFEQENGIKEFGDVLYEAFTDELPVELSEETISVLHGIVEGIAKAVHTEED